MIPSSSELRPASEFSGHRDITKPRWISISILTAAVFFILALFITAVFEPSIRLLHAFQALVYVAVISLRAGTVPGDLVPAASLALSGTIFSSEEQQ